MIEKCFDEGTIQSFLDGELPSEMLESVARHVALCDDCSLILTEAEEESAFAFSILDEEFNSLVPTERIRTNVFQAIEKFENPKVSIWQKVWNFASVLTNPSVAAFASLIVVAGVFVIILNFNQKDENYQIATNTNSSIIQKGSISISEPEVEIVAPQPIQRNIRVERTNYKPEPKIKDQKSKVKVQQPSNIQQLVAKDSIDGEETYLKTIATLENTVKDKKDSVLRASSRVSYERDMAVVEDSIKRMRDEVRKNPKNEAAKQILRNSYQNKIELLNSVSERGELMARLD